MLFGHFGLWREPDFRKLWVGRTISLVGSQVTRLALPLAAILILSAAPPQLGLLRALSSLPAVVISAFAGILVDRLPRRPIMIVADLARALLLFSIPLAAFFGELNLLQLYAVALGSATFGVFFEIAYRSFLPSLIEQKDLVEANGKLEAAGPIAEVVGPSLAGILIQLLTAPLAILIDGISYLISVISLSFIAVNEAAPSPPERRAFLREIGEGLTFVRHEPQLRSILIAIGLFELFDSAMMAIYVLYVTKNLGLDPALLGLIFATGGVGGIVGALVSQWLADELRVGWVLVLGISLAAIGDLVIPTAGIFQTFSLPLLALAELCVVFGVLIFVINLMSLLQVVTPNHLLGRVNATIDIVTGASGLFGALLGGFVGSALGLELMFVAAGFGTFLSVLAIVVSPIRRLTRLSEYAGAAA